ncbi:MAG: hypothetical protein QOE92_2384 [Chloroflexota bacterium]|jgi:hypothetical protein|nr:hypothetical protein [Chloroflexota bacterium]
MRILEMVLPRLEAMAVMASDRQVVRDPQQLALLREDYRYMAGVCRSLLPELEEQLADLPEFLEPNAPIEDKISYQMALIRRTNRLHLAVESHLAARPAARRRAAVSSSER